MYKNLAAVITAACFFSPFSFSVTAAQPAASSGNKPVKAAFVYVTPVFEAGWTHQHDEGRKAVEKSLGNAVKTTVVENVAEGADSERVVRDLAQQGHDIIFTTSFGYMEPTLKVA
ncbi:MAG: BMP family ABC transporter substrate-binding protein, partial [Limnohabitans sp.]